MSAQSFALPPPGKVATLFPLVIGVFVPLALLAAMALADARNPDLRGAAAAVAILPLLAIGLAWAMRHRRVELLDAGLRVRRWPIAKTAAIGEFDLAAARIVDLEAEPSLRPALKIAGTRLPGFASGWFWLKDRRRAYVLLTERRRVLVLPRHDGTVWLLGVERADALLAALRARG
jgi:hypothetical protein